jgi:hypothetical protein
MGYSGGKAPQGGVYMPSAARTTLQAGTALTGFSGVTFIIKTTAKGSAPSVTPSIEGYDEASDSWVTLLTGAAITNVGTVLLTVSPSILGVANVALQRVAPARFRLYLAVANADSLTYSVGVWLEP